MSTQMTIWWVLIIVVIVFWALFSLKFKWAAVIVAALLIWRYVLMKEKYKMITDNKVPVDSGVYNRCRKVMCGGTWNKVDDCDIPCSIIASDDQQAVADCFGTCSGAGQEACTKKCLASGNWAL